MSLGLSSASDVITFDQNWHHLWPTSAGGKDLFNDSQVRVIGLMEPEICRKMLKTLSEKLWAKFPATTHGVTKIEKPKDIHVDHFFVQNLSQNFDFCACPSKNVVKCNTSGKKGKLVCCKCLFDQIKANFLGQKPAWKPLKCPRYRFLAKSSGSQWINRKDSKLKY